ncbi:MAG TPA: hypothetical protein VI197_19735 [Polyangiaceae bacterium]
MAWWLAACDTAPRAPAYSEARRLVDEHCISCHSKHPTERAFPIAPGGIVFDTATDMVEHAERIRVRVALDRSMPLMNKTGMTDAERQVLASWVTAGTPTATAAASIR